MSKPSTIIEQHVHHHVHHYYHDPNNPQPPPLDNSNPPYFPKNDPNANYHHEHHNPATQAHGTHHKSESESPKDDPVGKENFSSKGGRYCLWFYTILSFTGMICLTWLTVGYAGEGKPFSCIIIKITGPIHVCVLSQKDKQGNQDCTYHGNFFVNTTTGKNLIVSGDCLVINCTDYVIGDPYWCQHIAPFTGESETSYTISKTDSNAELIICAVFLGIFVLISILLSYVVVKYIIMSYFVPKYQSIS